MKAPPFRVGLSTTCVQRVGGFVAEEGFVRTTGKECGAAGHLVHCDRGLSMVGKYLKVPETVCIDPKKQPDSRRVDSPPRS